MPRKKTPTNANAAAAAINLEDDEQFVEEVTTVKKIGREKRATSSEEVITVEADDEDLDVEDERQFSDNSIASVLFGDEGEERFDNQFCTIAIRRHPDSMNDRFISPCAAVTNLPPLRNIELTADKMDIEDRVRSEYGGGHYYFQIFFDGRLRNSWKSTLSDDPAAVARSKAEAEAKSNPQPAAAQPAPQPPADPMDSMLNSIVKMKALKDALFGDDESRMKEQIADLKAELERAKDSKPEAQPLPDNLVILEKALGIQNPTLQERLLDAAFPDDSGGHWIPETIKTVFEHKEEIGGILSGLLGGFAPRPASPPNIESLMRQQPPTLPQPNQELPTSSFRRRQPAIDESAADEISDDATAKEILGEIVIEEPSAEFLTSITISPDEVTEPEVIEND